MRKPKKESFRYISPAPDDPTQFYYKPITSYFYWKRCELAASFITKGPPVARCLELACGTGVFLPELSRHAKEIHAVDIGADLEGVKHMLDQEGLKVHLQKADICALPFADGHFDLVVGMSCLEHLTNPELAIREAKRVLAPGGTAIFGVPIETPALNLFFKSVGFDHDEGHVAQYDDVLDIARKVFPKVEPAWFPHILPMSWGLYLVLKCSL